MSTTQVYYQLGSDASFTPAYSGPLILQCYDGDRTDNSGSVEVTIAGDGQSEVFTALCEYDVPSLSVVAGQTYTCKLVSGQSPVWCVGAKGQAFFDIDGNPEPYSVYPFGPGDGYPATAPNGLKVFSLVGYLVVDQDGDPVSDTVPPPSFTAAGILTGTNENTPTIQVVTSA